MTGGTLRDDVELSTLAQFGDIELAETAGVVVDLVMDMLCAVLMINPAALDPDPGTGERD